MNGIQLKAQAIEDPVRLEALDDSNLLDTLPEESYDRYTRLAAALLGAKVSLVSLVARDRQFFKSQVCRDGPPLGDDETKLSRSFCKHVVRDGRPFLVEDARHDLRVSENPAVGDGGVVAYLGMPIATVDGNILGSLCVIDRQPRQWSRQDQQNLADLACGVMREIELAETSAALRETLKVSRVGDEDRERELVMLAHDMRTPAAAVSSGLSFLAAPGTPLTHEQRHVLQLSQESVDRLLSMTQQILETGRLHSGTNNGLKLERISVSRLLRRVSRMLRPSADEAGVALLVDPPDELVFLRVDPSLVERLLLNFLVNAIKYSPPGGKITMQVQRSGSLCRITVNDEGPGVADEMKTRIFSQFVTGPQVGESPLASFGIGLALCKAVAEAHGGEVGVSDAPGGGSAFYCLLPMG
jgi:signal transduction histidine kinase